MSEFSSLQGKVSIAAIVGGVAQTFRFLGDVSDFKLSLSTSKVDKKESYSGNRALVKTITSEKKAKVAAKLGEWSAENLALAVRGKSLSVSAGTVTSPNGDTSPSTVKIGDIWALSHQKVSVVVVKDSSGTPATVAPANYSVDADFGTITLGDVSTYTLPLKATYSYAAVENVAFFSQPIQEVAMRFEGVNTAENNAKVLVEVYRVAVDPAKDLDLITNAFGELSIDGDVLIDPSKPEDLVYGQFGRYVKL